MALTTNQITAWKLNESSGNAVDSIGGFTLTNNNSVAYGAGKFNNGAQFGASNSSKSLTTSNQLGINGGAISVSAWIKPSSYPSSDSDPTPPSRFNIFSQNNSSAGISYMLHLSNVSGTYKLIFSRWKNSVAIHIAEVTYTPPTGSWTHVVGTYDGTTVKVYVNAGTPGTVASSGGGSGGPDGTSIGSNMSGGAYFSGDIDDVYVWDRAITSTEVSDLYNGTEYPYSTSVTVSQSTPPNATFSIPAYTVTAIRNVTQSATVQTATFSVPSRTITTAVTVAPSVQTVTFSIPTANVYLNDVNVSVGVQTATFSIPSATVTAIRNVTVSGTVASATFGIPAYTSVGGADISVSPSAQVATFSIPTYTAGIGVSVSVAVQAMTFSTPSRTVTGEINALCTPSAQALTVTIPSYTTTAIRHATILPDAIALVMAIPAYEVIGDFWQEKFSDDQTSWSDKY